MLDEMPGVGGLAEGSGYLAGSSSDPRPHLGLWQLPHRHHSHAGLEARHPGHGNRNAVGTLLAVARRDDPRRVKGPTGSCTGGEDRPAPSPGFERMAGSHAVRDVDIGAGRLNHDGGESLGAVDDGEMGSRSDRICKESQRRQRNVAHDGLHLPAEGQDGKAKAAPAIS